MAPAGGAVELPGGGWQKLSQSSFFHHFIVGVIVVAGILVGMETSPALVQQHGWWMKALDHVVLGVFVAEIVVKVGAEGRKPWRYFRDPWNIFDFLVVATCFLPFGAGYATVLRLARLRGRRVRHPPATEPEPSRLRSA